MNYFDGINFVVAGEVLESSGRTSKHFDSYYGIQYNHAGRLQLAIDHGEPQIVDGAFAFISCPGPHFAYSAPPGETRHHVYTCFQGERVRRYLESGLLAPDPAHPLIRITRPERFLETCRLLHAAISRPDGESSPRSTLLLEDLLLQLHEQPPEISETGRRLMPLLKRLASEMRRHPELEWNMAKEAAEIGISYPYFRKLFTEIFGWPPHRFLLDCRLRQATELLLHSDCRIAEIAAGCGFEDEYYFSRIFKKHRGVSPLRYRQEFFQ